MPAPTPPRLLLLEEDDQLRERARIGLQEGGYEVLEAASSDEGLTLLEDRTLDLAVVAASLTHNELHLFEEFRARRPELRIMVLAAEASPELVTRALYSRVDDIVASVISPGSLVERVAEALALPSGLPELEFISLVPHWIEVRFAAEAQAFRRLRRFLEVLDDSLPRIERSGMLFALSELIGLAIEASEEASGEALRRVSIACYRLGPVWGLRVRTQPGVRFTDPLDRLRHSGPRAIEPGQVASSTWSLEAVTRYVDHLITSDAGNEAMILRRLPAHIASVEGSEAEE